MKLPKQVPPVTRPALIKPHTVVNRNQASEEQRLSLATEIMHGANYNDPMRFSTPIEFCGCHLLFGNSAAMCQSLCLW